MWNWLVSALASEIYPSSLRRLSVQTGSSSTVENGRGRIRYRIRCWCQVLLHTAKVRGKRESTVMGLNSVRTILSTGSPLLPDTFDYIYSHLKSDVHLASISGGTDIMSCFVLGNPWSPVHRGEIQGPGLAMDMDVYDDDWKFCEWTKRRACMQKVFSQ